LRKSLIVLGLLMASDLAVAETIFYLHGRIIEVEGVQAVHERFGLYDYLGTIEALRANGATVISELRPVDGKRTRGILFTESSVDRATSCLGDEKQLSYD